MPTDTLSRVAVDRWAGLSGIALLLTGEPAHAEVVLRDVHVVALRRRVELRNPEAALAYLRHGVVRRARRVRGCRAAARLDTLPRRQREALMLRVYAGASDRQTGTAIGCDAREAEAATTAGLAALGESESDLRDRLTAYVAGADVAGPEPQQAATVARTQRRRRAAGSAVVGLALVAAAAVGVTALARHRSGPAADPGRLPGLVPVASIRVPAGLGVDDVDSQAGQVWALGYDRGNRVAVLHGPVGGGLTRLGDGDAVPPNALANVAVSGGRAFLVTSDQSTATARSVVTTYDARTDVELGRDALPVGDTAAIAQVVGGGATEALVVVHPDGDGSGSLTVSLLSGGRLVGARGPVVIPADELPYSVDADEVRLVLAAGGLPRRVYLSGPVGSAPVVDLDTGDTENVVVGGGNANGGGSSSQAVGEVDGEIVYTAQAGTFLGSPTSLTTQQIGDGSTSVEVLAGRAYESVAPTFDTLQALDPVTHQPTGPILTLRGGEGQPLPLPDGEVVLPSGLDGHGFGGTLTFYAAP